jgi:hypothetical protein
MPGSTVFKIARASASQSALPAFSVDQIGQEMLEQFCVSEGWSGDLSNGLFKLGEKATATHGLQHAECGLLNLVRCYDAADRNHVLALFEQAATTSSSFCFSTTIILATGQKQPLFCIGESSGLEQRYSGLMRGIFFLPRFQVDAKNQILNRQ